MCSISGYITKKEHFEFAKDKLVKMMVNGEIRGTDASGIAFTVGNNSLQYCKAPQAASEFVQEPIFSDLLNEYKPAIAIAHNRAKTQGDQAINHNNHPIVTKTGLIMVHNGIISNDKELAKEFNLTLDGEVDSEIIVRMIEYYIMVKGFDTMKAIRLMAEKVKGSMCIALLNTKEPRTLYVMRSTNPLALAYHKPTGTILFASTESIIEKSIADKQTYFNGLFAEDMPASEFVINEVADNTGIKITTSGWESFAITRPAISTSYSYPRDHDYKNYGQGYTSDAHDFTEKAITRIDTKQKKTTSGLYTSQKPFVLEKKADEAEIKKALQQIDLMTVWENPIIKPSEHLSEVLLARLERLQDMLITGNLESAYGVKDPVSLQLRVDAEIKRIIDTLNQRVKNTKRDIYVPTPDEISKFGHVYPDESIDIGHFLNEVQGRFALTGLNIGLMTNFDDETQQQLLNIMTEREDELIELWDMDGTLRASEDWRNFADEIEDEDGTTITRTGEVFDKHGKKLKSIGEIMEDDNTKANLQLLREMESERRFPFD